MCIRDRYIEADTDNSLEADTPKIVMKQDGGAVVQTIGITGDANDVATGTTFNSMYFQNNSNTYDFHWITGTELIMSLDTSTATLLLGRNDAKAATIQIFGHGTGSTVGGQIQLFTAADHDSTYPLYSLQAHEDDFRINRHGQTDDFLITSAGYMGISTTPTHMLHIKTSQTTGLGVFVESDAPSSGSPYIRVNGDRSDNNNSQSFSGGLALDIHNTSQKVAADQKLGTIYFGGNHTNSTKSNILYPASISAEANDTFDSATDMPTDLVFYTGATGRALNTPNYTFGTEAFRIASDQSVVIQPTKRLYLDGGSDTFILEGAANTIDFYVGNTHEFRFENDGDFHADGDVIAYSTSISDIAVKKNINIIENAVDKVSKLRGVSFDWKNEKKGSSVGLIAQDVEKVFPELVAEKMWEGKWEKPLKTLHYEGIIGLLVESIKELKDEIMELKNASSR